MKIKSKQPTPGARTLAPAKPALQPSGIAISRRSVESWTADRLGDVSDPRLFSITTRPPEHGLTPFKDELIASLRAEGRFSEDGLAELGKSFDFMVAFHNEETFPNGEKLIIHLFNIAKTVLSWGGTPLLASAALLHLLPPDQLDKSGCSPEIRALVDAKHNLEKYFLYRLDPISPDLDKEKQNKIIEREARYIAKMSMIMESETDIWLLEAADAYVSLKAIDPADPRTESLATRSYYSLPIALRAFDLEKVAMLVEDIALLRLDRDEYERIEKILTDAIKMERKKALDYLKDLTELLSLDPAEYGISHRVEIDVKSVASTKKKLERGETLTDPSRFRFIIKGSREQCKELGEFVIFNMREYGYQVNWPESKNYLAGVLMGNSIDIGPKDNSYESLHLNFVGPQGEMINVQVRTEEMHENAELGEAHHGAYKNEGLINEATRAISHDVREGLVLEGRRYGGFKGRLYRVIPYPLNAVPTLLDLAFAAGARHGLYCPEQVMLTRIDRETGLISSRKVSVHTPMLQGDRIDFEPIAKPGNINTRLSKVFSLPAIVALKLAQKGIVDKAASDIRASEVKARGAIVLDALVLEETSKVRGQMISILKRYGLSKPTINIVYSRERLAKLVGAETVPELMMALALASNRDNLSNSIRAILRDSMTAAVYEVNGNNADLWLLANNVPGILRGFLKSLKGVGLELIELKNVPLRDNRSLVKVRVNSRSSDSATKDKLLSLLEKLKDLYQGLKPPLEGSGRARLRIDFSYSHLSLELVASLTTLLHRLQADILEADLSPVIEQRTEGRLTVTVPESLVNQFVGKFTAEFKKIKRASSPAISRF